LAGLLLPRIADDVLLPLVGDLLFDALARDAPVVLLLPMPPAPPLLLAVVFLFGFALLAAGDFAVAAEGDSAALPAAATAAAEVAVAAAGASTPLAEGAWIWARLAEPTVQTLQQSRGKSIVAVASAVAHRTFARRHQATNEGPTAGHPIAPTPRRQGQDPSELQPWELCDASAPRQTPGTLPKGC